MATINDYDDMMKISLKALNEEYELEEREIKYLYPCFFRFDNQYQTSLLKSGRTTLNGELLKKFRDSSYNMLTELIEECYEEPPLKKRQKHPTLFEKFVLSDKKYVVDYTTSILGRLIYTLFLRLQFIDRAVESGEDLVVTNVD